MSSDDDRALKQREAGEREAARLWRVFRTVKEMVKDRGYELTEEEVGITFDEFKRKYVTDNGEILRTQMDFSANPSEDMRKRHSDPITEKNPNPSSDVGTIWIHFNNESNVGIKQLRAFAQDLIAANHHTGILITAVHITSSALRIIPATAHEAKIECFMEQDLLVNITHHELVPKHVLLSKEERAALLKRYRLKDTQLPRIQVGDPVSRYLGLKRGQVVKIIRKSETAGRYASYRLCV